MPTAVPVVPVVGIGASAGGLEALETFFRNVPEHSGLAYVVVQHLDPTHKGLLAELLQHVTTMPVTQVTERIRVKADAVYVIPPNKDMTIGHGALELHPPAAPRGLRLPIDCFFESLARNSAGHAVAVILSGMGRDGTIGVRAIKEHGGAAFVQEPTTARFESMPESVIAVGLADVIAPVNELPPRIVAHLARSLGTRSEAPLAHLTGKYAGLERILSVLRQGTGHDFSLYKPNTIYRRVERRMAIHQVGNIATYTRLLQETPDEVQALFNELLIGVTSFFRDGAPWEQLAAEIIPTLIAARPADAALRIWVTGCASGEEAYSLAITFSEVMDRLRPARPHPVKIFATDLDAAAVDKARSGLYPAGIAADVAPERLRRWFTETKAGYQITKGIREMVIFAQHDVIMDPPFTRIDLLACRNLLIYLTAPLQQKLLQLFHYALNPAGILFLGSSETIGAATPLFVPIEGQGRIYRRLEVEAPPALRPLPSNTTHHMTPIVGRKPSAAAGLQADAEQLLLKEFSPAAVITSRKGDILFVSGKISAYLQAVPGKANWNVFAMSSDGLRDTISDAFRAALLTRDAVTRTHTDAPNTANTRAIAIRVQSLHEPTSLKGTLLFAFTDEPVIAPPRRATRGSPANKARVDELEALLAAAQAEPQTHREHTQSTQEEVSSANEEMQSANEELQSTNEELTTSKEEMQSMNEELQTLNRELEARVDDLSRVTNDMKNLLDSTEIAIVFLDLDLQIRLFTAGSRRMFRLIPGDVGRPLTDLAPLVVYPELADDSREVLRTLVARQREAQTLDGRWCLVRIMPYRTLDDRIDGVTITFSDINVAKELEASLRTTQAGLEEQISVQDRLQADAAVGDGHRNGAEQ